MRVSNLTTKNNMIYEMKRNYEDLKTTEKQLGSGKRFQKISEEPIRAITSIYSRIRLNQIEQYSQNLGNSEDRIQIAFDKLASVNAMLTRTREIAVQAANGTFNQEDRGNMAIEIEEILQEMISHANTQFEEGYIFSGSKTDTKTFEVTYANDTFGRSRVENVIYQGDPYPPRADISPDEYIQTGLTGNQVFWAETHTIVGLSDTENYVSDRDQKISIDDYQVNINTGDSLDVVIEKINREVPSVSAFKRRLPGGEMALGLETNYPHQMALLDIEGGTVLNNLGILKPGPEGQEVFTNISPNTLENKTSIFDALIRFRKSLESGNLVEIGGNNINGIENAINNVLNNQTKISSVSSRIIIKRHDLETEKENIIVRLSKSEDMDMAEAAVNLNEINNIHQLSLQTAARYIRPTLLNFL